jgi:hypothetical protein
MKTKYNHVILSSICGIIGFSVLTGCTNLDEKLYDYPQLSDFLQS